MMLMRDIVTALNGYPEDSEVIVTIGEDRTPREIIQVDYDPPFPDKTELVDDGTGNMVETTVPDDTPRRVWVRV